jgi:hypothetical protein
VPATGIEEPVTNYPPRSGNLSGLSRLWAPRSAEKGALEARNQEAVDAARRQQAEQARLAIEAVLAEVAKDGGLLFKRFQQTSSQLTGTFISLCGLALIGVTFGFGITTLLNTPEFIASMIAGVALCILGPLVIAVDNADARGAAGKVIENAAAIGVGRADAETVNDAVARLQR